MRDNSTQCPSGLREKRGIIRTCVNSNTEASCSSSTYNLPYSNVCGQIRAYQFGYTDAFNTEMEPLNIESYYLDGISLTHGSLRQHIWTFVSALDEVTPYRDNICPCFNISSRPSPSFQERIISVIREVQIVMDPYSTATTLCGMEMVVGVITCVVPLTILHGSTRGYHKLQLMILR